MLNIRINLQLDTKKMASLALVWMLALSHLMGLPSEASALEAPTSNIISMNTHQKVMSASLTRMDVAITRAQAEEALKNPYAKFYDPETMAFLMVMAKGMPLYEWRCLDKLWNSESHFNPKALNKSSKAYGIAQFLPSTWGNYKVMKTKQTGLQIEYGLRYIAARYSTPCIAWGFHYRKGWY